MEFSFKKTLITKDGKPLRVSLAPLKISSTTYATVSTVVDVSTNHLSLTKVPSYLVMQERVDGRVAFVLLRGRCRDSYTNMGCERRLVSMGCIRFASLKHVIQTGDE